MASRKLGTQGAEVHPIGYGCMCIGGGITYYDESMRPSAEEAMAKFLESGGNHIDTSNVYGTTYSGESERILGEMIAKHGREKFFVATKCTLAQHLSKEEKFQKWGPPCADPEYIKEACDQCLERLGIDCIDLFYLHRPDPKTKIEDSMLAMKELVDAGKIKYVGLSEHTPEMIRRAHAVQPITAVQQEWSVMARDLEEDIVPVCKELGIGIVAYSPLARGLATGTQRSLEDLPADWRKQGCGRYASEENMAKNVALADKFGEVAKGKGCTSAQLALAWVLAQCPEVVVIPGTVKPHRMEENMKSVDVTLTDADLAAVAEAVPPGEVAGPRYSQPEMTYNGK